MVLPHVSAMQMMQFDSRATVAKSSHTIGHPSSRRTYGPSKGCERCRSSKVKCDEKRPSCQRCSKRGHSCVYRDPFAAVLRDETIETAKRVQQRGNKPPKCLSNTQEAFVLPHRPMSRALQDLAINRFLYDFVVPSVRPNASYFIFSPQHQDQLGSESLLDISLSAAANANFWRRSKSFEAREQGLRDYGKALRKMNTQLQTQKKKVSTEILSAAYLLSARELIATLDMPKKQTWSTHVSGAAALIRDAKNEDQEDPNASSELMQALLVHMIVNNLLRKTRPSIPRDICLSLMPPDSYPAAHLGLSYDAAEICAEWRDAEIAHQHDYQQLSMQAGQTLKRGLVLDEEMVVLMHGNPEAQIIRMFEASAGNVPTWLRSLYDHPGAPKRLHQYLTIHLTHRWQHWRADRLVLLETLMSACEVLLVSPEAESLRASYEADRAYIQSSIEQMVDGICQGSFSTFTVRIPGKSEPRSFEDVLGVRGYQLLWPLWCAGTTLRRMCSTHSEAHSKLDWLYEVLSCVRDDLGILLAQNFLQTRGRTGSSQPGRGPPTGRPITNGNG